jgi:hypothetical protein
MTAPFALAFRRAARPQTQADKPQHRHLRRFGRKAEPQAAADCFECTPFGRRRKRAGRAATFVKVAIVAGLGGAVWYLI